ncbi:MAG: peroxide stress protein YaaA, partial [Flavobacteriaceae bacterium]|nr:peroxide stress protein YaaA [Flavobacteriaceae bacterium]
FFAKKARGMMLRYMAQNSISTASDLLGFNAEGYHYSAEHTKNEFEPVFVR